jgi:hypothetical protein
MTSGAAKRSVTESHVLLSTYPMARGKFPVLS